MENKLETKIQKLIDKYREKYRDSVIEQIGVKDSKKLNRLITKSQHLKEIISYLKRLQHFVKINTCNHSAWFLWEENDNQLWTCQCLGCEKIKLIKRKKYEGQVIKTTKRDRSGDPLYRDYQKIKEEYNLLETEEEKQQMIKKYQNKKS